MKRQIKFRVWNPNDKEMYIPSVLNRLGCKIFNVGNYAPPDETHPIMQFTGLLDRNNTEIYEDDIVKIPGYYAECGIVEYSSPSFHIWDGSDGFTEFNWEDWNEFEVIGNIYEHLYLLK